ncbi:MAG: Enoyl-CoA hydratase, partial [uncultured Pseudonocardia sp.]
AAHPRRRRPVGRGADAEPAGPVQRPDRRAQDRAARRGAGAGRGRRRPGARAHGRGEGVLRGAGARRARRGAAGRPGDVVRHGGRALQPDRPRPRRPAVPGRGRDQRAVRGRRAGVRAGLRPADRRGRAEVLHGLHRHRADGRLGPVGEPRARRRGVAGHRAAAAQRDLHRRGRARLGAAARGRPRRGGAARRAGARAAPRRRPHARLRRGEAGRAPRCGVRPPGRARRGGRGAGPARPHRGPPLRRRRVPGEAPAGVPGPM